MSAVEKSLNFAKKHWIKILPSAIIVVLIVALACSVNYYNQENRSIKDELQKTQNRMAIIEDEKDDLVDQKFSLENDVDNAISERDELQAQYDQLAEEHQTCTDQITELNNTITEYESQIEEYATLVESLNNQIAERDKTIEEQKETISYYVSSRNSSGTSSQTQNTSRTVYWTPGGEVYHSTPNCPSLSRSRQIFSGTISQSGKGRACKNCF